MFKRRIRLFSEYDDVRGFLLFDEPSFEYHRDIGVRLFANFL
jgi:hypothetical protein